MLSGSRLIAKHFIPSNTPVLPLCFSATMSTFTLPNSSPECPVRLTPELSKNQLLSFPAFKTWISTLQHSLSIQENKSHVFHAAPYKLRNIDVQSVDFLGGGRLGFSMHIFGVIHS
jgi:hypothetical protein